MKKTKLVDDPTEQNYIYGCLQVEVLFLCPTFPYSDLWNSIHEAVPYVPAHMNIRLLQQLLINIASINLQVLFNYEMHAFVIFPNRSLQRQREWSACFRTTAILYAWWEKYLIDANLISQTLY